MALYDNRVFKAGDEWWVAEVHGASGAGFTERPRIMHEMVIFTSLSDEREKSRSATLPVRHLRTINHDSIVAVLRNADPFSEYRLPLRPTNLSDAADLALDQLVVDSAGLRWSLRETKQFRVTASGIVDGRALEVVCLDDSAMRAEVALDDDHYEKRGVVERVRSAFIPYHVSPKVHTTARYYRWKRDAPVGAPRGVELGRCYAVERYRDERGTKFTLNLLEEDGTVVATDVPVRFLEECAG